MTFRFLLSGPQSPCERTDLRMAIVADHLGLSWTGKKLHHLEDKVLHNHLSTNLLYLFLYVIMYVKYFIQFIYFTFLALNAFFFS